MTAARWNKLAIIAGGGDLPINILSACQSRGEDVHIIRISGSADQSMAQLPGEEYQIGEAGKILKSIKEHRCDGVVFVGNVRRPDFSSLRVDWRGAVLLPKVVASAMRGDGAILKLLVEVIEAEGLCVVGAEQVMASLAAPQGALGRYRPNQAQMRDIVKAGDVINALGPFDIGQGVVIHDGFVLAIEAAEGTDLMLARCTEGPVASVKGKGGVLVKKPKPGQEMRVDLPVIGPETVKRAVAASLDGIAFEAGCSLIIDSVKVIKLCDDAGLYLYGFSQLDLEKT